eukprot:459385_1
MSNFKQSFSRVAMSIQSGKLIQIHEAKSEHSEDVIDSTHIKIFKEFEVDLRDVFKDWKNSDYYVYHPGILQIVCVTAIVCYLRWYVYHISSVLVVSIWSLTIMAVSVIKYRKNSVQPLLHYINVTLCIADASNFEEKGGNIYNFDHTYHGLFILLLSVHSSFFYLLYIFMYHRFNSFKVYNEPVSDPEYVEEYMLFRAVDQSVYILFFSSIVFTLLGICEVSPKCHTHIKQKQNEIFNKHANSKSAKLINNVIKSALNDWRKSKYIKTRKPEFVVTCIFFVSYVVYNCMLPNAIVSVLADQQKRNIPSITAYIIVFCITIINMTFGTIFIVHGIHSVLHHFRFPAILMENLTLEILQFDTIQDLCAFWEIRNFYKSCVVKTYSFGISSSMALAFISSVVTLIAMYLAYVEHKDVKFIYVNMVPVVFAYVGILTVSLVTLAQLYYSFQLGHLTICNQAILKFKQKRYIAILNNQDIKRNKYEIQVIDNIFSNIKFDIEQNSEPIKCLGIEINYNFLVLLKGVATVSVIPFIGMVLSDAK